MSDLETNEENEPVADDRANLFKAIFWITGTLLSFLTLAIAVRELSDTLNSFQIMFMRTIVALFVILVFVAKTGSAALHTRRLKFHFFRNIVHYGATLSWIVGVSLIPLAQVFALEFTMPIWVAILAVTFLGERMTIGKLVAIIFGFFGVLIILRPGLVAIEFGSIIVLVASMGFAIASVCAKSLASTDTPLGIQFYMFIIHLPIAAIGGLYVWVTPEWADLPWILLTGILSLTAHYTMTKALILADISVVLPIDFLRMPMIAVLGFFLYAEPFSAAIFIGAVLIFAGNYYNIRAESRSHDRVDNNH